MSGRVLLTGGSGFIGRSLSAALGVSREVLTPSHTELDLTDTEAVETYLDEHRVDAIVHSATKPGHRNAADPTGLVEVNTRMYLNLVRREELCPRLILLSTGAAYDPRHYQPKLREEAFDSWVPVDDASYSKYVIAKLAEPDPRVTELRLFGVFGPGEDYAIRFISNALCKALAGLPITLRQDRMFDYLWIEDLAQVVEHFLKGAGGYPAYNVTPDHAVSLLRVAQLVRDTVNSGLQVRVAAEGLGAEYSGDNSRLRAEIPTLEFTSIENAVVQLRAWYEAHWDDVDTDALLADK